MPLLRASAFRVSSWNLDACRNDTPLATVEAGQAESLPGSLPYPNLHVINGPDEAQKKQSLL